MKKCFLLALVAAMIVALPANAGIKFGLKGGVNLSSVSFSEADIDPSNYTGFQVGPIAEFTLPIIGIGFDAALLYSQDGFKVDVPTDINLITGEFSMKEESMKTGSLLIPLNLKYKLNLLNLVGAYATAGPYASFKVYDNMDDYKELLKTKSFGAGLNFGLGVELLGKLQVGANYQLGLTDDFSAYNYDDVTDVASSINGSTRVWSITAALFF